MIKEHLLYVFPRFDEDGKKGLPIIGPFRDAKEKVNILKQVFTLNGNAFKCTTMRLRVPSVRISGCALLSRLLPGQKATRCIFEGELHHWRPKGVRASIQNEASH